MFGNLHFTYFFLNFYSQEQEGRGHFTVKIFNFRDLKEYDMGKKLIYIPKYDIQKIPSINVFFCPNFSIKNCYRIDNFAYCYYAFKKFMFILLSLKISDAE